MNPREALPGRVPDFYRGDPDAVIEYENNRTPVAVHSYDMSPREVHEIVMGTKNWAERGAYETILAQSGAFVRALDRSGIQFRPKYSLGKCPADELDISLPESTGEVLSNNYEGIPSITAEIRVPATALPIDLDSSDGWDIVIPRLLRAAAQGRNGAATLQAGKFGPDNFVYTPKENVVYYTDAGPALVGRVTHGGTSRLQREMGQINAEMGYEKIEAMLDRMLRSKSRSNRQTALKPIYNSLFREMHRIDFSREEIAASRVLSMFRATEKFMNTQRERKPRISRAIGTLATDIEI